MLICITADFNYILSEQDRINCQYRKADTKELQDFMEKTGSWDVPILQGDYTWFDPDGKCSILDRALVNHLWRNHGDWVLASQGRKFSDHAVILLSQKWHGLGMQTFQSI